MADIKKGLPPASVIDSERVVFNIGGNNYRLVVKLWFPARAVYIKFIGTTLSTTESTLGPCREAAMMDIRPIRTDADHAAALEQIDVLWGADAETVEGRALEVLVTLVDAYEARQYVILPPDPIEAIKFRMEQLGLVRRDLEPFIGSRARVSELLNGSRSLTLPMIRRLRDGLGISADLLVGSASAA